MNVDFANLGQELMKTAHSHGPLVNAVIIIFAVLTVFFGYKLLKLWVSLAGFFIGVLVGGTIAGAFKVPTSVIAIAAIVVGILLAVAAFFFYRAGIFLFAGFSAFNVVTNVILGLYTGNTRWWVAVLGIVAGILVGILAVKFIRPMVILSSAISGAVSLSFTAFTLMGINSIWILLAAAAVIAILGMIWQFKATERAQ